MTQHFPAFPPEQHQYEMKFKESTGETYISRPIKGIWKWRRFKPAIRTDAPHKYWRQFGKYNAVYRTTEFENRWRSLHFKFPGMEFLKFSWKEVHWDRLKAKHKALQWQKPAFYVTENDLFFGRQQGTLKIYFVHVPPNQLESIFTKMNRNFQGQLTWCHRASHCFKLQLPPDRNL